MIRAVLLVKIPRPVMDRLPQRTQDAIFHTAMRLYVESIEARLPAAASLVRTHADRLDDRAITELRERLDQEEWQRRMLRETQGGLGDLDAWLRRNPQPRLVRDYTVPGDPDASRTRSRSRR